MLTRDFVQLAWAGFLRRRGRTLLSVLGVSVGALALVLIISLGEGMENHIEGQFTKGEAIRQILVRPGGSGRLEDEKREELESHPSLQGDRGERIRRGLIRRQNGPGPRGTVRIFPDTVDEILEIDGVERADPMVVERVGFRLTEVAEEPVVDDDDSGDAESKPSTVDVTLVAAWGGAEQWQDRLILGSMPAPGSDEVLLHEVFLFQQGYESQEAQEKILGTEITITLRESQNLMGAGMLRDSGLLDRLNAAEKMIAEQLIKRFTEGDDEDKAPREVIFRVAGVVGEPDSEADVSIFELGAMSSADVFVSRARGIELSMQSPMTRETGFRGLLVVADSPEVAEDVSETLEEKGLNPTTVGAILKRVQSALSSVTLIVSLLSAVALLVAALGIVNTMTMSVLERTREIGILKSIGAKDAQIRRLFLLEGALIGLAGGVFGCLLAYGLSLPGDYIAERLFREQTGSPPQSSLFAFPFWLVSMSLGLSTGIAILAAYFPSRRASRIQPVDALRHD